VRPSYAGLFVYEAINPAFEALAGLVSEEVRDTAISDCMGSKDARSVHQALDACLAQGDEIRLCHRLALGGLRRTVETVVAPICDPLTGAIVRLVGSHRIAEGSLEPDLEQAQGDDPSIGARLASIQEDIQQRIASDLHDSTCQHLIAASLGLMRIRGSLGEAPKAEQICNEINASIDRALREIRTFSYLLHPQNLASSGLKAAIERYAEGFAVRTSSDVSVRIAPGVDRLPYETQRSLLRVVQEALANVFRHAKATKVEIAIDALDRHFELSVTDNGCGMSVDHRPACDDLIPRSLGVGIPAMRARLQQIGGTLEICSRDNGQTGTTLRAVFPRGHLSRSIKSHRNRQYARKQVMS
jgi:signal transduction histidine kinase